MGCCNTNKKSLIVTTINHISRSYPVHHDTKFKVLISLTNEENIIIAHNFILEQNTNQTSHCFGFHLCIVFLVKGLDIYN